MKIPVTTIGSPEWENLSRQPGGSEWWAARRREVAELTEAAAGRIRRACLICGTDLSDTMGCYVFVGGIAVANRDVLVCVEHGANHGNCLSLARYTELLAGLKP